MLLHQRLRRRLDGTLSETGSGPAQDEIDNPIDVRLPSRCGEFVAHARDLCEAPSRHLGPRGLVHRVSIRSFKLNNRSAIVLRSYPLDLYY
ncbi:MAG: hypothetical protein ABI414_04600 [Devosia sp.]